jgi:hypothetical protein
MEADEKREIDEWLAILLAFVAFSSAFMYWFDEDLSAATWAMIVAIVCCVVIYRFECPADNKGCQAAVPLHWDTGLTCTTETCHRPRPCPLHDPNPNKPNTLGLQRTR